MRAALPPERVSSAWALSTSPTASGSSTRRVGRDVDVADFLAGEPADLVDLMHPHVDEDPAAVRTELHAGWSLVPLGAHREMQGTHPTRGDPPAQVLQRGNEPAPIGHLQGHTVFGRRRLPASRASAALSPHGFSQRIGKTGAGDLSDQREVLIGRRRYQHAIDTAGFQHRRKRRIHRQATPAQRFGRRLMGLRHCHDPDRGRRVQGADVGSPHAACHPPGRFEMCPSQLALAKVGPASTGRDRISDNGLEPIMCFSSRDAARVIDRSPGLETADDRLTDRDVVERVVGIGERRAACCDAVVEGEQLALERAVVRGDLLGAPRSSCSVVATFDFEHGRSAAQERRRKAERDPLVGAVAGELHLVVGEAGKVEPVDRDRQAAETEASR